MAAFLLFDKITTWNGSAGELLAGGQFRFFEVDTTTPQDVYGDRALSVNNGVTVDLDASGRLEHECWADTTASYYVELYDSDGVKQGEISHIEVPGGQGQVIPVPSSGEYLTGDGTNFLTDDLSDRLLPDQTGHSNEILGTDGTTASWVTRPADGAAGVSDIAQDATSFKVADMLTQTGTGSGTNVGGRTQNATITWPVAFDSAPIALDIAVTSTSLSTAGNQPSWAISTISATGATIKFTMGELDDDRSMYDFNAAVQFMYKVTGVKA